MKHFFKTIATLCALSAIFIGQTQPVAAKSISDAQVSETYNYTVEQVVEQKLGKGSYTYENLSSFSDSERYILVEGNNCYLIYDNQLKDFLEFSTECNSVYYGMDKSLEKVYYSPTYYFYKVGNEVYDLYDGSELSEKVAAEFVASEATLKQNYLQAKAEYLNSSANGVYSVNASSDSKSIADSFYFKNLKQNMGYNGGTYSNSCSYVALEMLMSYYDTFYNDNVIDENYDVTGLKSFSSYDSIDIKDFTQSPGINDNFHAYLINYGQTHGYACSNNNNCIPLKYMVNVLNEHLDPKGLTFTSHISLNSTQTMALCKEAVDSDNPFVIWFRGNGSLGDYDHDVIGYGYVGDSLCVNFGWKGTYSNVYISGYTVEHALYINFESGHFCSNNYVWTTATGSGTICPCGEIVCNHNNYYESNGYKICSDCGYRIHLQHNFTYTPILGKRYHWAKCACGYRAREACVGYAMIGEISTCYKCGQPMTGSILSVEEIE